MNYKLPIAIIVFCTYTVSGSEEYTNTLAENSNDESYSRVRRGFNMLRLGRGLQMLRLGKRSLPMLRLGRSAGSSLSEDDIQYLMSLMRNDRQVPLPRYGKDLALQYLLMNAMKNAEMNNAFDEMEPGYGFGYDLETTPERQIRPAPRPGRYRRSTTDQETPFVGGSQVYEDVDGEAKDGDEKRAAPLMRYGKYIPVYGGYGKYFYEVDDNNMDNVVDNEDDNEVDKRAMRMLRLGRGMRMLRLGKRPAPVDDSEITEADKRALRLLRLGKRPSFAMLRLGRGDNIEEDKRALRLLRLGKRADNEETS